MPQITHFEKLSFCSGGMFNECIFYCWNSPFLKGGRGRNLLKMGGSDFSHKKGGVDEIERLF